MFSTLTDHIEIDREQRSVRKDGQLIHLTGMEYGLLAFLSERPNRICTRQDVLDHIWGDRFRYDTGTIDVHLNALRRKLGWTSKQPVETIRGIGFRFRVEKAQTRYTVDLQTLLTTWLHKHETQLRSAGLVAQLRLTPFINELTIEPDALQRMLDGILEALLPGAQPGILLLATELKMHSFSLSLDINGTANVLTVPLAE